MLSAPSFGQLREPMTVESYLREAGTHCQSLPLKKMVAQSEPYGCSFDEFSTNILYIYIYGQARLTCLPENTSIYLCIKESIAPF